MTPMHTTRRLILPVTMILAALMGCSSDDDDDLILPVRASLTIDPAPAADPALFLEAESVSQDVVMLNVMVRTSPGVTYDAVNLHINFNPGVLQFAGVSQEPKSDGQTYEPFGLCGASQTYCAENPYGAPPPGGAPGPLCQSSGGQANQTGDLLIGMAAFGGRCDGGLSPLGSSCDPDNPSDSCLTNGGVCRTCSRYDQGGTVKVMTLTFVAATVGSSRIEIVPWTQTGDCEVLNDAVKLAIPCFDGGATVTAVR